MAHGPVVVTVHALRGTLLLGAALGVLVRSLRARRRPLIALAGIAFVTIVIAWLSGARFVGDISNGASLAMALAAGIAILSYVLILFTTPGPSRR